ncbi:MAG: hypothetical protein ACREID_03080, partial [Planctomycetota bacterium]
PAPPEPAQAPAAAAPLEWEETPAERSRAIQALRTFLMNHYFASRKTTSLLTRCVVCEGTGRKKTPQLDKSRRVVTVPCTSCHETGYHLDASIARRAFWLVKSPLYRGLETNRADFDARLAEWREDPRTVPEFLKSLKIDAIDYHGAWAVATYTEKGHGSDARKGFTRKVDAKLVRVGKRWFFADPEADACFFEAPAADVE